MDKKPSECISEFLNFVADAKVQYRICEEEVNNQDKLTQDYLHKLELGELKCGERSKIATKLAINRKDRRYYKYRTWNNCCKENTFIMFFFYNVFIPIKTCYTRSRENQEKN